MSKLKEAIAKTLNGNHRLIDILKCIEDNVVKELEWEQDEYGDCQCEKYVIDEKAELFFPFFYDGLTSIALGQFSTLDEAKAAAEKHHQEQVKKLLNL